MLKTKVKTEEPLSSKSSAPIQETVNPIIYNMIQLHWKDGVFFIAGLWANAHALQKWSKLSVIQYKQDVEAMYSEFLHPESLFVR